MGKTVLPTFRGLVLNTMDALMLFEAYARGQLRAVIYRLDKDTLIKSGDIFIFNESTSGIKRWTDGVAWSPSRIFGDFLIYRELKKLLPPGEKERHLIGPLEESCDFRPGRLIKKTLSVSIDGASHRIVSYYKDHDVENQSFPILRSHSDFKDIYPRAELLQKFDVPVEMSGAYTLDGHMPTTVHSPASRMQSEHDSSSQQYIEGPKNKKRWSGDDDATFIARDLNDNEPMQKRRKASVLGMEKNLQNLLEHTPTLED